ncbi:MAG: rhomboid family intramembrane serine protease [Lachnospiraceae bacterium]|nr:rhomboid family intramembrane serine protease [Lachnospiraceae bacterium]MBO7339602.1 rhomboid family intramembrane serine protease [Lachnospiraceae bacterium]MBP5262923.1 rhomboid family intramembrane serine protease [Lachnospiraceae bacterium]MBP5670691.1 rhomboid family intramembrane serine protease [Lachnospiraceae bacterium]MBP5733091.1 rhomboid family intramembrane serine protease [Lachnospiraceae bacterium]
MIEKMRMIKWKEVPFVSIALVATNVIVFLITQFVDGSLFEAGALNVEGVLINKQYGRFLWSMFLHAGIEHLFNNMVMLYFMGTMIEKEIGHLPYGVIYFLSGLGGGLLSLYMKLMLGNPAGSVGASGAIFGLDGLLLAMVLFYRRPMPMVTPLRVCLMIALSLYAGLTSGNIDNAAHFGGLLVGLILGALFCLIKRYSKGLPTLKKLHEDDDDDEEDE